MRTPTTAPRLSRAAVVASGCVVVAMAALTAQLSTSSPVYAVAVVLTLLALAAIPLAVGRVGVAFAAVALLAFLFTRPNIAGEAFGFVGLATWLALALLCTGRRPNGLARPLLLCGGVVATYWAYVSFIRLSRGDDLGVAIPSLVACVAALSAGWAFGSSRSRSKAFGTGLAILMTWQVVGYAIAAMAWRVGGPMAGHVTDFDLEAFGGRTGNYSLWATGIVTINGHELLVELGPRLTGWAGEPGVLAATFAFIGATYSGRMRPLVMAVAGLGIVMTQSTAGILIYAIAVLLVVALGAKTTAGTVVSSTAAGVAGLFVIPLVSGSSLGLKAKMEDNPVSFNDRLAGASSPGDLLTNYLANPFGVQLRTQQDAITMFQESLRYGPLVLLLAALAFLAPLALIRGGRRGIPGTLVLVLTIAVAQPGFTNPLWILLFAWLAAQLATTAPNEGERELVLDPTSGSVPDEQPARAFSDS